MVKKVLTDLLLQKLKPLPGKRTEIWDLALPGFGYRSTLIGRGTFFAMYRLNGKQSRLRIGAYPMMTLGEARDQAKVALKAVSEGRDPVLEGAEKKREDKEKRARTFEIVFEEFLQRNTKHRPSTRAEVIRLFRKELYPTLRAKPISEISRQDINKIINGMADRGSGITANRALGYLGGFSSWLIGRGEIETSLVWNIAKPAEERSRDRVLTDNELKAVWIAAGEMGFPFGPFVRVLIVTAQRRGEAASMLRSEVDLRAGLWSLSREATKTGTAHSVPLSALAQEIIADLPDRGTDLVFAAAAIRRPGNNTIRPISGWSKFKSSLDGKVIAALQRLEDETASLEGRSAKPHSMPDWTLHDLRRTAASGMARLGIAPHVVERLLNHSSGTIRGVAKIYNRHSYGPEMRHAVDLWGAHVEGLLEPAPDNVVRLEAGAA